MSALHEARSILKTVPLDDAGETSAVVELRCNEFTAMCPVTNLPDFGALVITFAPVGKSVEVASLTRYLYAYRNLSVFHENAVLLVCEHIFAVVEPWWCEVRGEYIARQGININPRAYVEDGELPEFVLTLRAMHLGA